MVGSKRLRLKTKTECGISLNLAYTSRKIPEMSGANNQGEFSRQRALEKQRKEMLVRGRIVRRGERVWLTHQITGGI